MEKEKIRAIRRYLSKNGVKYHDVQAELIDHFATAMENIERQNPGIRFKVALLQAHRNFGGREGFRKYVLKAEEQIQNKVWKMVGLTLLQFLKWPYLLATALCLATWHFILTLTSPDSFYALLTFTGAYALVLLRNHVTLRKLPFLLARKTTWALAWIFYWIAYIPGYSGVLANGGVQFGYTFGLIYFSFLSLNLIVFYRIPELAKQETRNLYPQIA